MSDEKRPWAAEIRQVRTAQSASDQAAIEAMNAARSRRRSYIIGAIIAAAFLIWLVGHGASSSSSDHCLEAQNARSIAANSTGEKRETALLYAAQEQQKCDASR